MFPLPQDRPSVASVVHTDSESSVFEVLEPIDDSELQGINIVCMHAIVL